MQKKQRRLAAIMFTDIVGYSSMMQKDEEVANRLRVRHKEVFQRLHEQYEGQILQYFGDGTLSIFPSTTAAVECAVALQHSLKKEPRVPIRIGIHTGDITFSDEEVYGDGVNIAARIEAICVPGGVFISGKTYDDIKNHPRLKARALGRFQLKNIHDKLEVFAITNAGITAPEYELPQTAAPLQKPEPAKEIVIVRQKQKWVATLLAFFFGIFGVHRFYLEQRFYGILYLSLFFLGVFSGLEELILIPAILGFVDFIAFLSMSRKSFDAKFNKAAVKQEQTVARQEREKARDPKQLLRSQFHQHIEKARAEYANYNYENAIEYLLKAVEIKYDDPEAHFLLARCYSVNEEAEKALIHLDVAVAFGLRDKERRIKTQDDLAFLRIQPEFDLFLQNNYRLERELPPLRKDWKDPDDTTQPDLLEQLNRLQKQWKAGRLSDEEYQWRQDQLRSED